MSNFVVNVGQKTLKTFLSMVFFGVADSPYVVPIQGNFENPQSDGIWLDSDTAQRSVIPGSPDTWIGYSKKDSDNLSAPGFDGAGNIGIVLRSSIKLQFVGAQSEEMAESVKFWTSRSDVTTQLEAMLAGFILNGLGRVEVSTYVQDGINTVPAFNVYFDLIWESTTPYAIDLATAANITGTIGGI